MSIALGNKPVDPFFRFPALKHPPEMLKYLGRAIIGIFSSRLRFLRLQDASPEQVINSVMAKLAKHGKGIVLMHDFQRATAEALPELLKQIKEGGYKVVQVVGKTPVEPLPEYKRNRAQGDGRRPGRRPPDVVRDQDHQRQLISA